MDKFDFIHLVRVKLEEVSPFDDPASFLAAGDDASLKVKPIDTYIVGEAGAALRDVLLSAPLHVLACATDSSLVLHATVKGGVAVADLPGDFLRLVEVRMPGWERSVIIPIRSTDPAYVLQQNRWTRGGTAKPVAALRGAGELGVKSLELYSLPDTEDGSEVETDVFRYIPFRFCPDADCADWMPSCAAQYAVPLCAARVLRLFGQENAAQAIEKEVSEQLTMNQ